MTAITPTMTGRMILILSPALLPLLPRLDADVRAVEAREADARCVGVRCVVTLERVVRGEADCEVVVLGSSARVVALREAVVREDDVLDDVDDLVL